MNQGKTPNPKMPGTRRMIGRTLQWMKAKQAAQDRAHDFSMPGAGRYGVGDALHGASLRWQWMKARHVAAVASHRMPVPGALMYRRGPRSQTATAWSWDRSREEAVMRSLRRPLGFKHT